MAPKKAEAKAKADVKAKAKADAKSKADAKAKAEAKAKAKAKEQPKAAPAKPEAKPVAEKSDGKADAKTKVEPKLVEEKKRKATEELKEEPPKKDAKTEELPKTEPKAEEQAPKEFVEETDAPKDARPLVTATVGFEPQDTTLNVVPALGGKMMMALTDGGMQYLIAGARASVGMTKGRYAFEAKVVEHLAPLDVPVAVRSGPAQRQLVRVGFSTANSELILGEGSNCVCFNSDGGYYADGKLTANVGSKFGKDQVVAVVLNLDDKSLHMNTVSLFVDGTRVCKPQKLPDGLVGKALFPHIAYRNVSVLVNFGLDPLKQLPFKCRLLQGAAQADTQVAQKAVTSKDGKCEVIFPVAFPDQGTFEWLDDFLADKPHLVELSDRMILDWAAKSGLLRPPASVQNAISQGKNSNDKPVFCFGVNALDDISLRKIVASVAPVVPRNYVVMEVKQNLVAEERAENLKRFPASMYKRSAYVIMGHPSKEFHDKQLAEILKEKTEKAVDDWKKRKADKERKKAQDKRMKYVMDLRKQADERRKKVAEEAKKKAEDAKKKAEERKKAADDARKKAVEEIKKKREELKKQKEQEQKAKEAAEKGDGAEDANVKVEEQEANAEQEDAKMEDAAGETKDELAEEEIMEEAKEETNDEVNTDAKEEPKEEDADTKEEVGNETKVEGQEPEKKEEEEEEEPEEWEKEPPVVELTEVEKGIKFKKKPIPDLIPTLLSSAYSKFSIPEKHEGFQEIKFEWDAEAESKAYLQKWVHEQKVTCRIEDLQPGKWFKDTSAAFAKVFKEWQAKQKAFKPKEKKKEKKETEGEEQDEDGLEDEEMDVFAVENVADVGEGVPLFKDFIHEDWCLVQLRFELYLLVTGFLRDVDDPGRTGIPEKHIEFYYAKYFSKKLVPQSFGLETFTELLELADDVVGFTDDDFKLLECKLERDMDNISFFVKAVEQQRRERQRRIDAGDETAKIKFSPTCMSNRVATTSPPTAGAPAGQPVRPSSIAPGAAGAVRTSVTSVMPGTARTSVTHVRPGVGRTGIPHMRPGIARTSVTPVVSRPRPVGVTRPVGVPRPALTPGVVRPVYPAGRGGKPW